MLVGYKDVGLQYIHIHTAITILLMGHIADSSVPGISYQTSNLVSVLITRIKAPGIWKIWGLYTEWLGGD